MLCLITIELGLLAVLFSREREEGGDFVYGLCCLLKLCSASSI